MTKRGVTTWLLQGHEPRFIVDDNFFDILEWMNFHYPWPMSHELDDGEKPEEDYEADDSSVGHDSIDY